jgi:ABC-2 type transport system ATP-binding protein
MTAANEHRGLLSETGALLEADHLVKRFDGFTAVGGISFCVRPGEVFGLLGSNGAGKTTTISMCSGLLRPTSGSIRLRGLDVQRNARVTKRLIGYVPDQPYVYDKLTGREFVTLMAKLYGVSNVRRRVDSLLGYFDLDAQAENLIGGYSHGSKQKIALAGVLVHDPMVLFLDEPTVGLDPRSARLLKDTMHDLAAQGRAVILSTHILDMAESVCHRAAILHRGRLLAQGTMDDLVHNAQVTTNGRLEDAFLRLTAAEERRLTRAHYGRSA